MNAGTSLISAPMLATMRHLAGTTPFGGAFVEVGVYKGGSAAVLHDLALEQARSLFLFDTFSGIPMQGPFDRHAVGDFSDTTVEAVQALCPHARIVVGRFPDSLVFTGPLAFVHADADQYDSTRAIGLHLGPRMIEGGLMLFDDYSLQGCRVAVNELFPRREVLPDGRALVRF